MDIHSWSTPYPFLKWADICVDKAWLKCRYPGYVLHLPKPWWINYRQGEQVQMLSRYGVDDLWIMGRHSWSLDNVQMWHGYHVDNPTRYLPCIHGISALYPRYICPISNRHPYIHSSGAPTPPREVTIWLSGCLPSYWSFSSLTSRAREYSF